MGVLGNVEVGLVYFLDVGVVFLFLNFFGFEVGVLLVWSLLLEVWLKFFVLVFVVLNFFVFGFFVRKI